MTWSSRVLSAAAVLGLAACSSGEVTVFVELDFPDPSQEGAMRTQALSELEVELIPFDRDAVFDSLQAAASTPEPPIPVDILEAQDSVAAAQARWQQLETRWGALRDQLQTINAELEQYSPAERRYRELFTQFNETEDQYNRIDRQKVGAFDYFDSLQTANLAAAEEIKIQRENWADDVFAEVGDVFDAKMQAAGREIVTDTTDTQGMTHNLVGLRGGAWWVHARYPLPFTELYWNVLLEVVPGEPLEVRLNRGNALERPVL